MDERGDNTRQDEAKNKKEKGGSWLDCCDPSCCESADGPGCLAAVLFIGLFFVLTFAGYALYYVAASMLGYQPTPIRDWDRTGTVITLVLATCTIVSGYAWWWMEKHWK